MLSCVKRVTCLVTVCAAISLPLTSTFFAQTDAVSEKEMEAAQEIEACSKNLRLIYEAIRAYQKDNKDIPNWLSDLVPRYLSDARVLTCPVCKRTGKSESPGLADPKLSSCYLYEFCPVPLEKKDAGAPVHTRREWKERQMALVGTMVPIVRCRQHGTILNLAYDGRIYQSPGNWETLLTNHINIADLTPGHIFGPAYASSGASRDPAKPGLVDLTPFYNAMLTESWAGKTNDDLAALPAGVQKLAGVEWDIHGVVQLASNAAGTKRFPHEVKGIKIGQKCQRLNFLHAAVHSKGAEEGMELGAFVVHYATDRLRLEIPIRYGQEVRDWHRLGSEQVSPKDLVVAWTGENGLSKHIRLFKTTWTNPFPDNQVESLDYVSRMTNSAPFLVAITAE